VRKKKEHEMTIEEVGMYRAQLQREKAEQIFQERKAERVANMSFERQQQIQKKLVTAAEGEDSENESEAEGAHTEQRQPLNSPIIT
jgi:hypothetical protein